MQDFIILDLPSYSIPSSIYALDIDQALTPTSLENAKKAWNVALRKGLELNHEALLHIIDAYHGTERLDQNFVEKLLSSLSFLAQFQYFKNEVEHKYFQHHKLYSELLNQHLLNIYQEKETQYQERTTIILSVSLAAGIIAGPSSWIAAGIFMAGGAGYAALSYQEYSKNSAHQDVISSLFHSVDIASVIDEAEWDEVFELNQSSQKEFYLSALALGLEPLFMARLFLGLRATKQGGWQASKKYLKSLFVKEEPSGRLATLIDRKILRLKKPVLSKLNWKTMWTLGFLYLVTDISTPQSKEEGAERDEEFEKMIQEPSSRQKYLKLSEEVYDLFQKYDTENGTKIFSLLLRDHTNLQKNYVRFYKTEGGDTELDALSTFLRNGTFYLPDFILTRGSAENVVFEIAKHIYELTFIRLIDQDSSPYKDDESELVSDAEKFAYECGGIPFKTK